MGTEIKEAYVGNLGTLLDWVPVSLPVHVAPFIAKRHD
jgi:hypothetical protein